MDFFSKIKSFFKKPAAETSSYLSPPSSSLTRSAKESFGLIFQDYLKIRSELRASDVKVSGEGINFKVNYRGSVVPFWLSPDLKLAETSSHLVPRSPSLRETKAKAEEETKFLRPASPSSVIEDALAMIAMGLTIDLNLVEISQALKNFRTSDIMSKV